MDSVLQRQVPSIVTHPFKLIRHRVQLSKILTFTVSFSIFLSMSYLCNGLQDDSILVDLAAALASEGVHVFRFDFAGNG
jgi:alpha/beta superfamily hydrolase